jgi:hypothetical protein
LEQKVEHGDKFMSMPLVKRLRFAAYVGILSGVIILFGLMIYLGGRLPEPYGVFELLSSFTLAIIVFPLAVILRDARRKRSAMEKRLNEESLRQ